MKTIKLLTLTTTVASLAFGIATALSSKKAESADASSLKTSNGMFVRVDSYGDISDDSNMKVIFVSEDGYALDDVWGNPGYVHGTRQGVSVSTDGRFVTLTNSPATAFTVLKGTESRTYKGVTQGSYAFKADVMSIAGEKKTNVYFAHNEEENYSGRHDYDYIGWFKDYDIAVQQRLIKESSWFLDFETITEDDEDIRVTHIRNAKNFEGNPNTELTFTHNYSDRFVSDYGCRVSIYRQYEDNEYSIGISQNPTKTQYEYGENIDLSGLEIVLSSPIHDHEIISYDSHSADFSFNETAYGSDKVQLPCYYLGFAFVVDIEVSRPSYIVNKIGELADYRGSYMLIEDQVNGYGFNTFDKTTTIYDAKERLSTDEHGRWTVSNAGVYSELEFTITKDSSGYHMINVDGRYLDLENFKMNDSPTTVEFISTSDGIRVKSPNRSDSYLYVNDEYQFGIGPSYAYNPVVLYAYPLTESEESALNTFGTKLLEDTDVCDPDGTELHITSEIWSGLATSFSSLSGGVQAKLVNLTYNVADITPRSMEFALSRYDYIYQKYHSSVNYIIDFIGRSSAGTMQPVYNETNVSLLISNNPNNAVLLITITALCSMTSIGVLLIIKKRKARQ